MIVGIAIDDWKLPYFERRLEAAGFVYTIDTLGPGALLLKATCDSREQIEPIVRAANKECALVPRN